MYNHFINQHIEKLNAFKYYIHVCVYVLSVLCSFINTTGQAFNVNTDIELNITSINVYMN